MKKLLSTILALALIVSTFTACQTTEGDVVETTKTPPTKYTTEGKTNELISDETMTGELVVSDYIYSFEKEKYDLMEKMYNELYPNVKLTMDLTIYEEDREGHYYDKLSTQIMAGKGPDLFQIIEQDVHKMMKSGALEDLAPYFENDKAFNVSKYNENVLYGTQFQGKQYVVPTSYWIPVIYGFSEFIKDTSFDTTKCNDYYTTMEQLLPSIENNLLGTHGYQINHMSAIYNGLEIFDYENNIVNLDNDTLKRNFEMAKKIFDAYEMYLDLNVLNLLYTIDLSKIIGEGHSKTILGKQESVMIPLKNANGKITADASGMYAINANSNNKQNAYNFIKMMLHPDFIKEAYVADDSYMHNIPMSNEYIEYRLGLSFTDGRTEYTDMFENNFYEMLDSIDSVNMYYKLDEIFLYEIMPQYFNDEKTLDECLEEAQSKLERYISE